jgi:transmembrane secretion effector
VGAEGDITESAAAKGESREQAAKATFRDVFAIREFRALWLAQLLSVAGDQLARVALTVLVYDRTQSAFLAAVTFVTSVVPVFVGGVSLAWLADRFPRRTVMIACDLTRCALVLVMAISGVPLVLLVVLLFLVTLIGAPFTAARAATVPDILSGDSYVMGTAVTLTTNQFALVIGFATGGAITGFLGVPVSLIADAGTFAISAAIVGARIHPRSASVREGGRGQSRDGGFLAGARLVFSDPALRIPMLFGWLSAFYNAAEGVAAPLARSLGGGALTVGVILAAQALGETGGAIAFSRMVGASTQLRLMGPLAIGTCAVLACFGLRPGLLGCVLVLGVSGACASYQLAANAAFVRATPRHVRSQAFGLAQGGMSLGQGLIMLLAGAAAGRYAPAWVIAACGSMGAILAIPIAIGWMRARRPGARRLRSDSPAQPEPLV